LDGFHRRKFICITMALILLMLGSPFVFIRSSAHQQPSTPNAAADVPDVYAEAINWLYVRYGPGLDYPRIGMITSGRIYRVLRRNAQSDWLEIEYPAFAGGRGWVFRGGVDISGNAASVPITTETTAGYPALTATPPMVVTSAPNWEATPISLVRSRLEPVSNAIYEFLLSRGFEPGTQKVGSAFLMDLQTGEQISINPGVAYSGMSLIKIPILVAAYRKFASIPTIDQAQALALMIVCSENLSANETLAYLGDGDVYRGSNYVTETMQALGFRDTFIAGSLATGAPEPFATPAYLPITTLITTADQVSTAPDPFNQTTPDDLGWLLASVYQCALDGTGVLPMTFPAEMNMQKCRGIVRTLLADDIPAMIRAGVPEDVEVAHKHGWVDEVHGDAGIVLTYGGDYVLVVMLRNKTWLDYEDSFPTIAEISRTVYNTYNPAERLDATHTEPVPICGLGSIDPELFTDLRSGALPELR
jgi:uncharacterized protein YraI